MQQPAEHAEHDGQHAPATDWLTIAEAAAALGVSVDTVRRRLKRGELQAEQVQTERGPVWRVATDTVQTVPGMPSTRGTTLPGTPSSNDHSVPSVPSSAAEHAMHDQQQRPELLKALELLERAQADVVSKAEAAAMWQARAELLAIQLQQAQARILVLEAPRESTPSEMTTGRESEGLMGEPSGAPPVFEQATPASAAPARRPWWLRWLPA